jgi:hypothetical protein
MENTQPFLINPKSKTEIQNQRDSRKNERAVSQNCFRLGCFQSSLRVQPNENEASLSGWQTTAVNTKPRKS